jgi:hypothetical protein
MIVNQSEVYLEYLKIMNILLPQQWNYRIKLSVAMIMFILLVSGASITSAASEYMTEVARKTMEERAKEKYAEEDNDVNRTCSQPHKFKGKDGHCHCEKGYKKVLDADAEHRCQYAPCEGVKEEAEELTGQLQEMQAAFTASQSRLQTSKAELQKYSLLYSNGTTSTSTSR